MEVLTANLNPEAREVLIAKSNPEVMEAPMTQMIRTNKTKTTQVTRGGKKNPESSKNDFSVHRKVQTSQQSPMFLPSLEVWINLMAQVDPLILEVLMMTGGTPALSRRVTSSHFCDPVKTLVPTLKSRLKMKVAKFFRLST